jgi:hypothetical protein
MQIERKILEAFKARFEAAGYTTGFGRLIDPDAIASEKLPFLSVEYGEEGATPLSTFPRLRSRATFDFILWHRIKNQNEPIFELADEQGKLKNTAFAPDETGFDRLSDIKVEVTYESSTIDTTMSYTGVAAVIVRVSVIYMG